MIVKGNCDTISRTRSNIAARFLDGSDVIVKTKMLPVINFIIGSNCAFKKYTMNLFSYQLGL